MTAQIPDVLLYDGVQYSLEPTLSMPDAHPRIVRNPLNEAWWSYCQRPDRRQEELWWDVFIRLAPPSVIEQVEAFVSRCSQNPLAKREISELQASKSGWTELGNSACWRNYVATWSIIDGMLHLAHLNYHVGFKVLDGPDPIRADWVSCTAYGSYWEVVPGTMPQDVRDECTGMTLREEKQYLTELSAELRKEHPGMKELDLSARDEIRVQHTRSFRFERGQLVACEVVDKSQKDAVGAERAMLWQHGLRTEKKRTWRRRAMTLSLLIGVALMLWLVLAQ